MKRFLLISLLALPIACSRPQRPLSERLKQAVESLKTRAPCNRVIPLEWAYAWPLPQADGDFLVLFYPLTGNPATGPKLYSPGGAAIIKPSGEITSCLMFANEPRQLPHHRRWSFHFRGDSMEAFEKRACELFDATESVARLYSSGRPLDASGRAEAGRFWKDFQALAEPELLPDYYRADPDFWEWLRRASGGSIPKVQ